MANDTTFHAVEDVLTPAQIAAVAMFQRGQRLDSREEALRVLVDIAIDTVTSVGDRFWDALPADLSRIRGAHIKAVGP